MVAAFSLAAQHLFSGPGLMTWCEMVQVQKIWKRNCGSQARTEVESLKAGCGNLRGSGSWTLDHTAAESQGASESSEGWMSSFLVIL